MAPVLHLQGVPTSLRIGFDSPISGRTDAHVLPARRPQLDPAMSPAVSPNSGAARAPIKVASLANEGWGIAGGGGGHFFQSGGVAASAPARIASVGSTAAPSRDVEGGCGAGEGETASAAAAEGGVAVAVVKRGAAVPSASLIFFGGPSTVVIISAGARRRSKMIGEYKV